jgi:predicted MFS family arabinose efflux permease
MHDDTVSTAVVERAARAPDRSGWTTVTALGIGAFAIGTDMFVVAGVLAGLAGELGVTIGTAGLTVTVFALAYAIGAPLLSALLGARPLRQALIGSLVLFGLFNAMAAVAPTLPVLLAARALGVILGGASTAMVVGAPLGVLLAAVLSWRAAFGLVTVLAAVTVVGLLRSGVGAGPMTRSTVRERLQPMRSPSVVGTLVVTSW